MNMKAEVERMHNGNGFIAALDQSGGGVHQKLLDCMVSTKMHTMMMKKCLT